MKKVAALVVTYNRINKLKVVLDKYLSSNIYSIVIVDNASTDDTREFLSNLSDKRIQVLTLSENTGGSGGFHTGLKYIHEALRDYEWVILQDDDAYPDVDKLNEFIVAVDPIKADVLMSAVYYPSGKISEMNKPGYLPFKNFNQSIKTFLRGNKGFHIPDELYLSKSLHEVDFASFVGLFVSKNVVERVGYPEKEWFIYGDDLDYSISITQANYKIYFDPNLIFLHDCESLNNTGNAKLYTALWRVYYTYRNGLIIYRKISGALFPLVAVYKITIWLLLCKNYKEKLKYLKLTVYAIYDGFKCNRTRSLEDIRKL